MSTKTKALLWEECRTGGVMALACCAVAIATIAWMRLLADYAAFSSGDFVAMSLGVLTIASFATALLQVLTIGYSGNLRSGFSRRVLNLPVDTRTAVGVTLGARTVFVLAVVLALWSVRLLIQGSGGGLGLVVFCTLLYLVVQLLDWIRHVVSGLTSLLLASVVALAGILLLDRTATVVGFLKALAEPSPLPFGLSLLLALGLLVAAVAVAYPLGLAAVRAIRTGRVTGIPEVWEWPQYLSLGEGRSKPFASPHTAQLWFEFRRFGWVMPTVATALIAVVLLAWHIEPFGPVGPPTGLESVPYVLGLGGAVLLGALVQGGISGLGSSRRAGTKARLDHLQPLSTAELVRARMAVNAASVAITIGIAWLVHCFIFERGFYLDILPGAVALGGISLREMVMSLFAQAAMLALAAWLLLQSRFVAFTLAFLVLVAIVLGPLVGSGIVNERYVMTVPTFALSVWLIGNVLGGFGYALHKRVLSRQSVALSAALWIILAGLLFGLCVPGLQWVENAGLWLALAVGSLAVAAFLPLPHIRAALDLHRVRHSARPTQDARQHVGRKTSWRARTAILAVALAALWLAWPAKPGYVALWHSQGWPATGNELDAWYTHVPDEENVALRYEEVAEEAIKLQKQFIARQNSEMGKPTSDEPQFPLSNLPIQGMYDLQRAAPIPPSVWDATQQYAAGVTEKIVPEVEDLAAVKDPKSRYTADFREGPAVLLPHLSGLRFLARLCSMAALVASIEGRGSEAADAAAAIIPLANSLDGEPILSAQLVRITCLQLGVAAVETTLNRSVLDDADLVRLQKAYANGLPPVEERRILDRAYVGESVMGLDWLSSPTMSLDLARLDAIPSYRLPAVAFSPMVRLLEPNEAARAAYVQSFYPFLRSDVARYSQMAARGETLEKTIEDNASPMTILVAILLPSLDRAREAEMRVRTQLDLTATGLAVERYRLAQGRLPGSLEELVPNYIDAVPDDPFRPEPGPISYLVRPGGEWVVYSFAVNMHDDQGVETDNWRESGDLTFTVAPLSVRTGPQILDKDPEANLSPMTQQMYAP